MPEISFVITCKGRLDHLRQTLPKLVAQPDSECIVVDYDCPDGTADWVEKSFPGVKLVRVHDAPVFQKTHAQNLGAAIASAPWLCFVDADVLVGGSFVSSVLPQLSVTRYLRPTPLDQCNYGSFVCASEVFTKVGGFDEAIHGCSYMDDDMYIRLEMADIEAAQFSGEHFAPIAHDDELRTRYYEIKDRPLNHRINFFYVNIKHDLMCQECGKDLSLDVRRAIYSEVKRVVLEQAAVGSENVRMEISLPQYSTVPTRYPWAITRKLSFELGKAPA